MCVRANSSEDPPPHSTSNTRYVKPVLVQKKSHFPFAMSSTSSYDDDFVLIDEFDFSGADDERRAAEAKAPWISPDHPLYFCDTQTSLVERSAALNAFSLENWYDALAEHTFKTVWLPISVAEGRALFSGGGGNAASSSPDATAADALLEGLARRIDDALGSFGTTAAKPSSAFLRLSTRSPKDSTALDGAAVAFMVEKDDIYWPRSSSSESSAADSSNNCRGGDIGVVASGAIVGPSYKQQLRNRQLASYTAGMLQGLRIYEGKKAVEIIAGSYKLECDMAALLSAAEASGHGDTDEVTSVILREWVDVRLDHEFRIFASKCCVAKALSSNKKKDNTDVITNDEKTKAASFQQEKNDPFVITGITQYFHYVDFGFLPDGISTLRGDERNVLKQFLTNFIESKIIPLSDTFMDACSSSKGGVNNSSGSSAQEEKREEDASAAATLSPAAFIVDVGLVKASPKTMNSLSHDEGSERTQSSATADTDNTFVSACGEFISIRGVVYRPMVIELNPFAPAATGGMLFDWCADLGLLWRGELPVTTSATSSSVGADVADAIEEAGGDAASNAPPCSAPNDASSSSSVKLKESTCCSPSEADVLPEFRIRDAVRADYDGISLLPVGFAEAIRSAEELRGI